LKEFTEIKNSFKNIVFELKKDSLLTRDELIMILNKENILARSYYYPPLHKKKFLYKTKSNNLINTDKFMNTFLIMPSGAQVNIKIIHDIKKLLDFIFINEFKIKKLLKNEYY